MADRRVFLGLSASLSDAQRGSLHLCSGMQAAMVLVSLRTPSCPETAMHWCQTTAFLVAQPCFSVQDLGFRQALHMVLSSHLDMLTMTGINTPSSPHHPHKCAGWTGPDSAFCCTTLRLGPINMPRRDSARAACKCDHTLQHDVASAACRGDRAFRYEVAGAVCRGGLVGRQQLW